MAFKDVVVIGQYIPTNSVLHRAMAETKIVMTLFFIIGAFISQSFAVLALLFGALALLIILSNVPLRFYARSAKTVFILALFTFVLNALLTGQEVLFRLGPIAFKTEGVIVGIFFGLRLFFLIFLSTVLTATTSPVDLADGLNTLLRPLEVIKVPVEEFSLIMTIALRFIPVLADEADRILKAQKARGLNLSGNVLKRIEKLVPIVIPLFVSAFMKAEDLAVAMEVRGYLPGVKRTKYKVTKLGGVDVVVFVFTAVVFVASYLLRSKWVLVW
jgi:energy-coupling factor transport system permease protein